MMLVGLKGKLLQPAPLELPARVAVHPGSYFLLHQKTSIKTILKKSPLVFCLSILLFSYPMKTFLNVQLFYRTSSDVISVQENLT